MIKAKTVKLAAIDAQSVARHYIYPMGSALLALAEADEAERLGQPKRLREKLEEGAFWLELELDRCARLRDDSVMSEPDALPDELMPRAGALTGAGVCGWWMQLMRIDPSQPVRTLGCITKRAAIETVALIRKKLEEPC